MSQRHLDFGRDIRRHGFEVYVLHLGISINRPTSAKAIHNKTDGSVRAVWDYSG